MSGETNNSKTDIQSPYHPARDQQMDEGINRFIVLFRDAKIGTNQLTNTAGLQVISDAREGGALRVDLSSTPEEGFVPLWDIDAAIVTASPERMESIRNKAGKRKPISIIVPDCRMLQAVSRPPELAAYLKGYRDEVVQLTERLSQKLCRFPEPASLSNREKQKKPYTWGLLKTGVTQSQFTGEGVKVAVLDTGFDDLHPDFQKRKIISHSLLNVDAMDTNGHGTHCIGTALGPKSPVRGDVPRYGCAPDAEIYACKVIHNDTRDDRGNDGYAWMSTVLAGIDWAISNKCRIINLSLGMPFEEGNVYATGYRDIFDSVSKQAMRSKPGTLIVAATGNRGASQAMLPACCKSILAVGAVDEDLREAAFSDRGADIFAPGVEIFSSFPRNLGNQEGYDRHSGTSMAAAHVSGIAALWAEALTFHNGEPPSADEICNALLANARDGIVQAP